MNTRIFLTLLLITAAPVSLSPVLASEFQSHGYLLASVGRADTFILTSTRTSLTDEINGDDTAFEIGVGFAFSPYLSIEGSYQDFGKPSGYAGCPPDVLCIEIVPFSREEVSVDGWSVALRGALPVTDSLSVFGRLGFLSWDASARSQGLNDSGTDVLYGAGIAADLNDRFGLQLSYEKAEVDIETVKLGVRLRF